MKEDFESKFRRVQDHLVGLWKFRQRGKRPTWCTTYVFKGNYYDTLGKNTPEAALDAMYKDLEKLKKKFGEE